MLAMLVVATALTRVTFVHCLPSDERGFSNHLTKGVFHEDDMTPEFTEQLGHHDHESDIQKRNQAEKYEPARPKEWPRPKAVVKNTTTSTTEAPLKAGASHNVTGKNEKNEKNKKRLTQRTEDIDVVDREDHVTQYLADLLVNTDSEITSLQASEIDDDREGFEVKEDAFFAFLTGQEKTFEVEGAWSKSADEDQRKDMDQQKDDHLANAIANIFIE